MEQYEYRVVTLFTDGDVKKMTFERIEQAQNFQRRVAEDDNGIEEVRLLKRPVGSWTLSKTVAGRK